MTKLIVRLFIRNYRNTEDPAVRAAYGKTAGLVGIITNLLLSAAKMIVGLLTGSIAILADAVNNLTDSASSVVTLAGFKLASKPADAKHPYGHARIEYIAGLIVSILILVLGVELGRSSLDKILAPEETGLSYVALGVLAASILVKLWQCLFYRKMGRAIDSATLKAAAADSLNDVIATSVVLAGSVASYWIGYNLDGWLGMAVAVFIAVSGIRLIIETSNPLVGMAPSALVVGKLRAMFDDCASIVGYHDLQIHDYGQHYFATVHVEMDQTKSLEESHAVIDQLERQVKKLLNIELVIHLDPVAVDDPKVNWLRSQVRAFLLSISPQLAFHDFHVAWGEETVVSFDLVAPYRFPLNDQLLRGVVEAGIAAMGEGYRAEVVIDHRDGEQDAGMTREP